MPEAKGPELGGNVNASGLACSSSVEGAGEGGRGWGDGRQKKRREGGSEGKWRRMERGEVEEEEERGVGGGGREGRWSERKR